MRKPFSETRACERIVKETLTSGWENPSLETFNSDSYDFFDNDRGSIAIWELRNLIDRVYEAGSRLANPKNDPPDDGWEGSQPKRSARRGKPAISLK